MIGNKRKEVIGNNVIELCVPKEFHKIIVENTGKKFTEPYEAILKRKNGKLVPIEIESRNVAEEGKQYRVTAIRDITERKNAEAENEKLVTQLRRSQKLETIGTLARGIAHDFNNMLTPILGYSDMSMSRIEKDNPIYSYMEQISTAAHRAKDLVQQILTFTRQIEKKGNH